MLKLLLFLVGLAGGAGGAAAWLLSEPAPALPVGTPLRDRLEELKVRFEAALAEGARAGQETENRLRHELDTYRRHPDRPATSS
jgi:hypothetical protein